MAQAADVDWAMATAGKKKAPAQGKKAAVAIQRDARLVAALASASWAEADEALAEALIECAELKRALAQESATAIADPLALTSQALMRAARRRGLTLFGVVGAIADFDASVHAYGGAGRPARVRIVREGVMRGREVLVRATVAPKPSAKRAPR